MSNEREAAKEVAIERWENEGGEVLTIASSGVTEGAMGRQQSKGDESHRASEAGFGSVERGILQ